jgi:hypothetical protein
MEINLKNHKLYDDFLKVLIEHCVSISFSHFEVPLKITFSDGQKICDEIINYDKKLIQIIEPHSTIRTTVFTDKFIRDGGFRKKHIKERRGKVVVEIVKWIPIAISLASVGILIHYNDKVQDIKREYDIELIKIGTSLKSIRTELSTIPTKQQYKYQDSILKELQTKVDTLIKN